MHKAHGLRLVSQEPGLALAEAAAFWKVPAMSREDRVGASVCSEFAEHDRHAEEPTLVRGEGKGRGRTGGHFTGPSRSVVLRAEDTCVACPGDGSI